MVISAQENLTGEKHNTLATAFKGHLSVPPGQQPRQLSAIFLDDPDSAALELWIMVTVYLLFGLHLVVLRAYLQGYWGLNPGKASALPAVLVLQSLCFLDKTKEAAAWAERLTEPIC